MGFKRNRVYYAQTRGCIPTLDFNCWGATMYVLGVEQKLKWVDVWGAVTFLNTDTYVHRKVKELKFFVLPEDIQPGDILTLWFDDVLVHTAVYTGRKKFFHKRGENTSQITDIDEILFTYACTKVEYRRLKV